MENPNSRGSDFARMLSCKMTIWMILLASSYAMRGTLAARGKEVMGPQPSFGHKLLNKALLTFKTLIDIELACATGPSG
jgi:hypothetical protein